MLRRIFLVLLMLVCVPAFAPAAVTPEQAQKLYKEITPSLRPVKYTWQSELGRQEVIGAGIVISDDGLILISMQMVPQQIPDEQLKDFKIIIPGDDTKDEQEIDAVFVGRDERTNFAYVRPKTAADATQPSTDASAQATTQPATDAATQSADASTQPSTAPAAIKWVPLKFENIPVNVGETVLSVGMLPKAAAYKTYFTESEVSALLRGPIPQVLVTPEGLTVTGSPVFNIDGKAIGFVIAQADSPFLLNDPSNPMQGIKSPPRVFVPASDFMQSFEDPIVEGKPQVIPWLGVAEITGLKKDVADFFNLNGVPAVSLGDVIPDSPASKAGLNPLDVITKFNGKPLERGDEPDEVAQIMMRKIRRMKAGDTVTLTVLNASDKKEKDVTVTLEPQPKQANTAARYYAEDLGFAARDVVFSDTYERKLPPDQKGVVIALVKPSSAAATGKLARGDLVTEINHIPVNTVDDFKKSYTDFRTSKPNDAVMLSVIRQGQTEVVRIEPPQ